MVHIRADRYGGSWSAPKSFSPRRLRCLYEIGKLLTRYESIESTGGAVLDTIAHALSLRTAALLVANPIAAPQIVVRSGLESGTRLADPIEHAKAAYRYLSARRSPVGPSAARRWQSVPAGEEPFPFREDFIVLPLVVGHEDIFGLLQLEPTAPLEERDLLFANAVVNQLSIALDRNAMIESRQADAEAEKARATEQRDIAETLRRRYEALLDNLDNAFAWEADAATLQVLYVSARAESLFGFPRSEWLAASRTVSDFIHPEDHPVLKETLERTVTTGANQRCEHRSLTVDGREIWFRTGAHLVRSGNGPARLQGLSVDVTASKRLEAALREADRRKDEFVAMLAHELRHPLAPIAYSAELLHDAGASLEAQRQARGILERQTDRLSRLVDELLDIARITTGKLRLCTEAVPIDSIVSHAVEAAQHYVAAHSHKLTLLLPDEPVWVEGDPARIEQVVLNLLHNAAKYTPEGGRIEVEVARDGAEATVCVQDNGVGIAPEFLPHVFDVFTQAEAPLEGSAGGLGIGLALVRRLVELHKGRVEVESAVGRGTEFTVRLPAIEAPQATPMSANGVRRVVVQPLRILVADENADTANSMALLLEHAGHKVSVADSGHSALNAARTFRPDVAFLDVDLPKLDGYEVARKMRSDLLLRDMVLVAMSAHGSDVERMRTDEAGFRHFLVKPAEFGRIREILLETAAQLGRRVQSLH